MHNVQEHKRGFKDGVRYSIQWLHNRAKEMNDPNARSVLNSAAFHLGIHLNDLSLAQITAPVHKE